MSKRQAVLVATGLVVASLTGIVYVAGFAVAECYEHTRHFDD